MTYDINKILVEFIKDDMEENKPVFSVYFLPDKNKKKNKKFYGTLKYSGLCKAWTLYDAPSWDSDKQDFNFNASFMDFEGATYYDDLKETQDDIKEELKECIKENGFY